MKPNRLVLIVITTVLVLLIPLTAMQITDEVNWNLTDFLVAGVLLLSTGLTIELIVRKVKRRKYRVILSLIILVILFLIWAELAVGIFGTRLSGS